LKQVKDLLLNFDEYFTKLQEGNEEAVELMTSVIESSNAMIDTLVFYLKINNCQEKGESMNQNDAINPDNLFADIGTPPSTAHGGRGNSGGTTGSKMPWQLRLKESRLFWTANKLRSTCENHG